VTFQSFTSVLFRRSALPAKRNTMRRSAQRMTLESVQTEIDELRDQTAVVERQLAKARENQDKEAVSCCQKRLLKLAKCRTEHIKRLAEQQKYQHELELRLLRAQAAGRFAADSSELFSSKMYSQQPLQFLKMSSVPYLLLPQKLEQPYFANVAVCKPLLSALLYSACGIHMVMVLAGCSMAVPIVGCGLKQCCAPGAHAALVELELAHA